MLLNKRVTFRSAAGIGITLFMLTCLLAGCGGAANDTGKTEPSADNAKPAMTEQTPGNADTVQKEPEEPAAAYTAPLTGLPSDHEIANRPFAIMINNFKAARPQSGLPHADVVWEVLAEGGITRLVAIFQSEQFTSPIGPIRSNRPYLIQLGEAYGGVLVHAGASNDALAVLQHSGKADMDEINNAGAYFYRDKSRKAPHNLYSTLDKLKDGAARRGYDKADFKVPSFTFSEEGATGGGTPATNVDIHFLLKSYQVSYTYDPATKLYARSINSKPHTDLTTGAQLMTTNIAVLGAKQHTYDDYGRLVVDLDSGGPAVLIQLGKAVECQWQRGKDGAIHLMKDGQELPMVPGKSYYHIVPMTPTFAEHLKYS